MSKTVKKTHKDKGSTCDQVSETVSQECIKTPSKTRALQTPQDKAPRLTSSELAQLKTLYLIKQVPPSEIAAKFNRDPRQIYQWITRLGLKEKRDAIAKRLDEKSLAKATSEAESALERWSPQIEELGDDTLELARKEVANPSKFTAKSLASYSSAMRNWSAMVREFNGLQVNPTANPAQVNIFVGGLQRAEAKPVEPSVDV